MGEGTIVVVDPQALARIQDETVQTMNARLATFVDHALGFGVLESTTKQQLVKVRPSPPFCTCVRTTSNFKSVENTATAKGVVEWKQLADASGVGLDLVARHDARVDRKTLRERSVVVFTFQRVLAKRTIAVPRYDKLLPVRKRSHLDKNRWLVELYGNQLCTTEYYGGQAHIAFTWNREAKLSIAHVIQAIDATVATNETQVQRLESSQMSEMQCRAHVEGFELPDSLTGNLTTVSSIMELIRVLHQLPILCAVPVDRDVVVIQSTRGFPSGIQVETHIRDVSTLEKIAELLLQVQNTEPVNVTACEFLDRLHSAVEDASLNNRPVLPQLRDLVATVATTLSQHGKCVELYKRGDELRLHTDNCDTNGVTAGATETLFTLTLGLAIPFVRSYQYNQFEMAPVWTAPEHYSTCQFRNTLSLSGYYDRVKLLLVFSDNDQLHKWRRQVDELCRPARGPRRFAGLFGAWP